MFSRHAARTGAGLRPYARRTGSTHGRLREYLRLRGTDQSTEYPPPWIDESAPLDLTKSRVQGEEYLREHHGAIVLRVAGIYGPGRNPLDWIKQGRVSPSRKYVNLIHAEDLAAICLLALEKGKPGESYNVSDGTARTWDEIYATAQQRWGVAATEGKEDGSTGKRISTAKLRAELDYRFVIPICTKHSILSSMDRVNARMVNGPQARRREPERTSVKINQFTILSRLVKTVIQLGRRRVKTGGVPSWVR